MCIFFFKQKTAYEMRISDWSSDVCSSDLVACLFGRQDIVRMNDLEFLAIGFQLAGDEALFMERQQLTRPARVPAEINQRDIIALSIRRMDAERRTSAAARVVIRSEERRVGKECVSTGRSRGLPYP